MLATLHQFLYAIVIVLWVYTLYAIVLIKGTDVRSRMSPDNYLGTRCITVTGERLNFDFNRRDPRVYEISIIIPFRFVLKFVRNLHILET